MLQELVFGQLVGPLERASKVSVTLWDTHTHTHTHTRLESFPPLWIGGLGEVRVALLFKRPSGLACLALQLSGLQKEGDRSSCL